MADPAVVSEREQKILGIIETARGKRAKFRSEHINMAHGAGGKATQSLIEGLLAPAFESETLSEMAEVHGVGEAKLARNGQEFLAVIRQYQEGA